jgi:hypothetical protein
MATWTPVTFAAGTLLEEKSAVKLVPLAGVVPVTSARDVLDELVRVIRNDLEAQLVADVVSSPVTVTTPTLYPGIVES